jgi:hypothetical protein
MEILQGEPNMKVRTIIKTVEALYGGYVITYGKLGGLSSERGR